MDLWEGKNANNIQSGGPGKMDKIVTFLCVIVIGIGIFFSILLLKTLRKIVTKQNIKASLNIKRILLFFIHSLIVATILTLTNMFPKFLGYNWYKC